MTNVIAFWRRRRKLNQCTKRIRDRLRFIERGCNEFADNIELLQRQRYPVSDVQRNTLLAGFEPQQKLLSHQSVFDIDERSREFLSAEGPWVTGTRRYQDLTSQFESLQRTFSELLLELHSQANRLNSDLSRHGDLAEAFVQQITAASKSYLANSQVETLREKYRATFAFFDTGHSIENEDWKRFTDIYRNLDAFVRERNQAYIKNGLAKWQAFFDNIDGKSLDEQQRIAVLTDEDNNLVLAGAGSGKTLTISGKVKFLVEEQGVNPSNILLIAFTKKAAEEMRERISERLGVEIDVFTFHKLGLNIISKARGYRPTIFDEMTKILRDYIETQVYHDRTQIQRLIEFFGYYIHIPRDLGSFDSLGEYYEHAKKQELETLKSKVSRSGYVKENTQRLREERKTIHGESVKSMEETLIANFLFLNGIEYVYEKSYEPCTRDEFHKEYKPDFYLPDYQIYIEHFGVTENDEAPWLSEIEERKYVESMQWKRSLHQEHGTTLIESFSYYNRDGVLLDRLKENLLACGVEFREVDFEEIFRAIYDQTQGNYFADFLKLIETFVKLFKSSPAALAGFRTQNFKEEKNPFLRARTDLFLALVEPIYSYYESRLHEEEAIDFNDMINEATRVVESGTLDFPYEYIMIDEYQDISKSRFNLAKAIKDQTGAKVMCVGDDWQSIFRFTGADMELFARFGDFFGKHELLRIEKTYRNSQELIDIAGGFIMKNPRQYRKSLRSEKRTECPVRVIGYDLGLGEALERAVDSIVERSGPNAEIMLLGRNGNDIKKIDGSPYFFVKPRTRGKRDILADRRYPNLRMYFHTTHASKGLEADHVILINGRGGKIGFPNRMTDDPLLSWVLTDFDDFPFAEERRLFYVALTRTRSDIHILAPDANMSEFVKELLGDGRVVYEPSPLGVSRTETPACPKCKTGHLIERDGPYAKFVSCNNYPGCDMTFSDLSVLTNPVRCERCGSYMIHKQSRFGQSYLCCRNHPRCPNTVNVD